VEAYHPVTNKLHPDWLRRGQVHQTRKIIRVQENGPCLVCGSLGKNEGNYINGQVSLDFKHFSKKKTQGMS